MENRRIEKALQDSESRYKLLVELSTDIIIVHSEGRISFVNQTGVSALGGSSASDILGKTFLSFVHPEYKENVREYFKQVILEGKETSFFEERLLTLTGRDIYIETALSPFIWEGEWAILIIGHDVTARKSTEEALRHSEERFKSMVQNIKGYIYSVCYENKVAVSSYHSPQCLPITGYSPEEYETNPDLWINMVYEDDKEKVTKVFEELKENPQQTYIEHRIVHKNGSLRWISNTYTILPDLNGEMVRMDGFIIDITDRKVAEYALQEQYLFLQKLIDTIPNPVFYKDISGVYQGCNKAFEKLLGRKRSEILGRTVYDLTSTEMADVYTQADNEIFMEGGNQVYEANVIHADGTPHNVIFNKAVFNNADGSVAGLVGVILDITKLKRIQEELRQTLNQLKEMEVIINRSPAVVFLWKAEKELPVEFVSDNIRQFGYTAGEFISGKVKYGEIICQEDTKRLENPPTGSFSKTEQEFIQDYRIVTKSGDIRWVDDRTWVRRDESGRITHYQGIVIDITMRKLMEQRLRDSEERYRTLAENSYDLICEINRDLHFLYLSPNFYEVLGFTPEEMLHKNMLEFIHIDDIPSVLNALKKNSARIVLRYKHKNGEWLWFESAGKKFRTASGEKRGVIVSRDVTDRKRLEQQIVQTEKLMALGEMAAMIAHEFRNALTSVKMILQLHSESPIISKSGRQSFEVAINSIYHMEEVVQQLLNFAHPAPMELQIEDLNKIIKDALSITQMQASKKFVQIEKYLDTSIPPLLIHAASIKEALINLILNATQAFDETLPQDKKKITIVTQKIVLEDTLRDYDFGVQGEHMAVRQKLQNGQEIVLQKGTECALIVVSDTASGIDPACLSRIFEPFFTTKEKGSGLGLPIVKRTVNAHNGIITVKSVINSGTTFKIYIPLSSRKKHNAET